MFEFIVNGKKVTHDEDIKLLPFLRDKLRITSAKDGCGEGACGACTVLVDGKAMRACLPLLSKLVGKNVVTIEGLSKREKDVYAFAFADTGAVQCGFCIPGMVISAKALIDANNAPTIAEVKKAIRGNICRCTGYIKIQDAILLAAKMFREDAEVPSKEFSGKLGENFHRVDAVPKTLGTGLYVDDIVVPDMIFGKALRSKYPRAIIKNIDISDALKHEQCVGVLTAKDIPGKSKVGHLVKDWDTLLDVFDTTRYLGDSLALVAVKEQKYLDEVLALIKVDYEVLAPITSPTEAMKENAPKIHENGNILKSEHMKRGDVDEALRRSKYVVTKKYSTPPTEHAFMEPECAIAMPFEDGLKLYTASQSVYDEQKEIAPMLGIEPSKLVIEAQFIGGGFGGKEDMSVQHHAALLAWILKKPVKVKFSRQESILIHPKRHAMEMKFTTGCDENGILTAMRAEIVSDTGAYASLGGPVLQRACTHAAGPYNYQNVEIKGTAVYTNNPPAGAFRGFGVTQSAFAAESNLNLLAEMVGISPWEIRFRNAIAPGQVLPNGQIADDSTSLRECLMLVKDAFESSKFAGIAASFKNSGVGVGIPDTGRCLISIEDGVAHIRTSAACIGQGMATVTTQIVCEITGILPSNVFCEQPSTVRTPNTGTTTASRQTVFTGEATARAAKNLKIALDDVKTLENLNGQEFYGEFSSTTDPLSSDKANPVSHVAYGYAAQVVILDESGKVSKVVAGYDVGTIVNPKAAEGQIEGGIVMGLGYGLTEDYPLKDCAPLAKYGTLGLWRATEAPEIEVFFAKNGKPNSEACGGKGVGELATIPTAPAVQGAYYAFDKQFRTKLPLENTAYKK